MRVGVCRQQTLCGGGGGGMSVCVLRVLVRSFSCFSLELLVLVFSVFTCYNSYIGSLVFLCALCLFYLVSRLSVSLVLARCCPVLLRLCGSFLGSFPLVRPFLSAVRLEPMVWPVRCSLVRRFFRLLLAFGVVVVVRLLVGRLPVFVRLRLPVVVGFLSPALPALLVCCLLPPLPVALVVLALAPGLLLPLRLAVGFLAWFFCPLLFLFLLVGPWLRLAAAGFRFGLLFFSCRFLRSFFVWSSSASVVYPRLAAYRRRPTHHPIS